MASLRTCALRHLVNKPKAVALPCQRRWARVHDVRFLATIPPSEKVYEKYRSKLDQKVKEVGVDSIEDLKKLYQSSKSSKTSTKPSPYPSSPPAPPTPEPEAHDKASSTPSSTKSPIKTLSSFFDLEKLSALPTEEISELWRLHHTANPLSLCAVIPTNIYRKIESTARQHPQFILPIGREVKAEQLPDGAPSDVDTAAEIHFLQWTFPAENTVAVLFTHLAEYKLRGEYAQPHTTVTHHLELAETKGLVLLQGEIQKGRGVSVEDGQWLLMCLQKFYGLGERPERTRLLEQFSGGDQAFKVEELVSEAEKIL